MNIRFIHDLEKKIFVNDAGVKVNGLTPEIAYGMKPVWEWQFINSAGEAWDFSQVVSWKAVIDTDYSHETEPMCRTLSGIYVGNDIVYCPMDALTTTYRDKANGKALTKGYFDLTGYDASGEKIFYFSCPVNCLYVLDPEEGVDPLDPPENYISPAQVEAIARGVVDAALEAYTPPPGGEGPTGPAPQFEFSATGIDGTWHATWVSGDLYLRVSTDEGVTWQGPIPLGTAQATFPLVAAWSDEITYATGALVAFGTPSGLYQANESVGYDQSPAAYPAKWQQIAGPGTAGTSSTWLLGSGAPAAELGNVNDQYLDELYNHYRKADGAWVQIGNIKGANGAGINNRGAWAADAAYSVGDGVTSNGSVWCCKVPHSGQEPPAAPDGVSLYWDLFVARGATGGVGAAGTVQIAAINMLAPTASAYASEGSGSTAARRIYTLNIPRASTGPAGSLRIEMGLPLETGEAPTLEEIAGSTPYNRAYRMRVPMGIQGERGTGMYVNATGTLAERVQYDSAAAGYAYLATDLLTDDLDHHYQAMYFKESASIGDWSDAIRLYMGQQGLPGRDGVGIQGIPGENAAVKPDQEFVADDLFEGTLIVEGTDPIAQVEVNDVSGHGHALSLAGGDSGIAITTRRDTGQTLVAFGPSVDLTYGGRVRFAQGLSGLSLYQMWLDAGHTGTQTDYINWLKETATRIAITADDLVDVGDGDLGVTTQTDGVVIAVIDEAGVQYLLADTEVWYAGGVCTVNLQRLLTLKSIETIPDTWHLILAGGKGDKGEPGDQPELSSSPAVALAATAAAGVSTVAARADHVHPTTGLVTPTQLGNFMPVTLRGVANGVASLGADGKVPASQLPEMSGSGGLSITRLRLARPYFDYATHLVIQAAQEYDFSDAATIIDTENNVADRAKVLAYNGSALMPCPAEGLGGVFSGQPVLVDLSVLTEPAILRYKWVSSGGDSDWFVTYFPSTGEAYVAKSGVEEVPSEQEEVPSEQVDTGSIRVSIIGTSQGRWSIDQGETWHSGDYARVLVTGNYTVTFKKIGGYDTPADQHVTIAKDETFITHGQYTESLATGTTSLRVHIFGADTGQWSIDDGVTWNDGGDVLSPAAGNYTVTLKPVSGYDTPESFEVVVENEIAVERNVFYLANIALGGYEVYNLNADGGPALLADGVNPESSTFTEVGNCMVINGAIVAFPENNSVSLNLGNQWKSAVGYCSVDADTGKVTISANAITNDGKLYGLLKAESDNYIRIARVDDASDWVRIPEINYFKKSDGSLWHYRSGNADLIKMGDYWDVVGKGILGEYSAYIVTDGADEGKVFIGINTAENDIRQLGSASNWEKVSSAIPGSPINVGGVSSRTSYLTNSSGELHIVYNNTNYDYTPLQYSFSTSRIGMASNWVAVKGYSYETGYSDTKKYYAWVLNSQGELYALQEKTLTYMGNGFADAILCRNYVLKSNGQLYALSVSSTTNPTCVLQEHFDDWTMISQNGFGMRNTEVGA